MAYSSLRIAALSLPGGATAGVVPVVIAGGRRPWFRRRRSEPFAACLSVLGEDGFAHELLTQLEGAFRSMSRYSVTSSLGRALLAAHTSLLQENKLSLPERRRYTSAIVAAARPNGVYIARTGRALVASIRAGGVWARSGDPSTGRAAEDSPELGRQAPPHVTSEFFPLEPGDAVLLLPGVTVSVVPEHTLASALQAGLDIEVMSDLLRDAPPETAGLVVRRVQAEAETNEPWIDWERAPREIGVSPRTEWESRPRPERPPDRPSVVAATRWDEPGTEEPATGVPSVQPSLDLQPTAAPATAGTSVEAPSSALAPEPAEVPVEPARAEGVRDGIRRTARRLEWTRLFPLLLLGVPLILALALVGGRLSVPGSRDRSVEDAGAIIQEARANPNRDVALALLRNAIGILEPIAPRDEGARALLAEARSARDTVLDVVRVGRVHRFSFQLPTGDGFRPAGLWMTSDRLLILDLGSQLLYRTDPTGTQLADMLRPGDMYEGQPVGQLVTAAWSPPRGVNTDGRLIVVDHLRSLMSINPTDSVIRRWWPPDASEWRRIGPAAATYEDLFLLDTLREEVWRYPTRQPGAVGTIAARAADDLRLGSAVDLATDGNLYVLLPEGRIAKLAPGSGRLPFDGTVPDRPLAAPVALFAHPDLDRLWILEPNEARVVELTNDGSYVRQFAFPPDMVRNAVSIHVDGTARELRVLTPQNVLLIQLD